MNPDPWKTKYRGKLKLVAEAYQKMGLLNEEIPSNEYIPKDFSNEKHLNLELGYQLQNEIAILSL